MPNPISRRALLKEAACGFGYLALAGLAAEQASAGLGRPPGPSAAALRPSGQADHLPLHARGSQPGRLVRLQASPGEGRRQDALLRGRASPRQHRDAGLFAAGDETALEVRAARRVRPLGLGPLPGDQQATSTTSASSTRCTPRAWRTARRPSSCIAARRTRSGRRWAPGSSMAWAARTETSPASSRSGLRRATAGHATTATPSSPRSTRGRRSARPADRPRTPPSGTSATRSSTSLRGAGSSTSSGR